MNYKEHLNLDTPTPSAQWRKYTQQEKQRIVQEVIDACKVQDIIQIENCEDTGYVFISFTQPVAANERGGLLLDLEAELKKNIDLGLTVWHSPQGDKSSLRRLRGVKVKQI